MEKQRLTELALECSEIIKKKLNKELTKEEYYAAIYGLDKKYPGLGFKEAAEKYIRKASEPDPVPKENWKKKLLPVTGPFRDAKPLLTGSPAKEFEKKRKIAQEWLPYKDD